MTGYSFAQEWSGRGARCHHKSHHRGGLADAATVVPNLLRFTGFSVKDKPLAGGKTCREGHFTCKDCAYGHEHCKLCRHTLR